MFVYSDGEEEGFISGCLFILCILRGTSGTLSHSENKAVLYFWLFIHTLHPSVWHVKQLGKQSSFFSAFSLALCGASPFCGASCGIPAFGWWIVASGSPLPSSFFAIVPPSLSRLLSHARSLFQISLCAPSRSAYLAPSRHT